MTAGPESDTATRGVDGGPAALRRLRQACARFDELVRAVRPDQWESSTPCSPWLVRDLINHVTVEDLWAERLLGGSSIADVGTALDGDRLGAAPVHTWTAAMDGALAAASAPGVVSRTVGLSFGDVSGEEYLMQLFADHLVHGWDLSVALGADRRLDPVLVGDCLAWFADHEQPYRAAGAVGPRAALPIDPDPQTHLLALFGRTS